MFGLLSGFVEYRSLVAASCWNGRGGVWSRQTRPAERLVFAPQELMFDSYIISISPCVCARARLAVCGSSRVGSFMTGAVFLACFFIRKRVNSCLQVELYVHTITRRSVSLSCAHVAPRLCVFWDSSLLWYNSLFVNVPTFLSFIQGRSRLTKKGVDWLDYLDAFFMFASVRSIHPSIIPVVHGEITVSSMHIRMYTSHACCAGGPCALLRARGA